MTSPTQLKYLDAMGIPVWVSRDLIIRSHNSPEHKHVGSIDEISSEQHVSLQHVKQSNSSAKSILDSLEQSSTKTTNRNSIVEVEEKFDDAVAKSVTNAKIPNNSDAVDSSLVSPTLINENSLFNSSQHNVYACGSETADWLVIGHSPEPFNGIGQEPFAGEAGILLDNMLRAVGIEQPRKHAYLVNVVDINKSADINIELQDQLKLDLLSIIEKVKPKIVLFVGQVAAQNLLNISDPLIIMRSKVHVISDTNIPCVVTYYPNYLLQKPADKRKAWDDLKLAMSQLSDLSDPK